MKYAKDDAEKKIIFDRFDEELGIDIGALNG